MKKAKTASVVQEKLCHYLLYRYYKKEPTLNEEEKQIVHTFIQQDGTMPRNLYEAKVMLYKDYNVQREIALVDCAKYNQYDFSTDVGKKIACLELTFANFVIKRLGYPIGLVPDQDRDVVVQLISEGFLNGDSQLWKDYHEYQSIFGNGKSPAGQAHDAALKAHIYPGRKTNIRYEDVQNLVRESIPYYFHESRQNLAKTKK